MNELTSRQRKLVYAGFIVALLVPIIYLGAPTSEDVVPGRKTAVSGGVLARMRIEHDLGESTLGQLDPSSAAMNLVLLGLRGPAAGVLHLQALEYQERKDWAKLKTTVDSIIKLQPHYVEIWKFQGWNLAFNVSREWDQVADRFYWVKEGIKFMQLGTKRNQTASVLFHDVGYFMGQKFGASDEKKFFRRFFVKDPDEEKFGGSSDPEINPEGKDNYLVSYDWYKDANELDRKYRIKGKTPVVARQGPSRALFDYAGAKQKEGEFDEANREAWDQAYREWTEVFGRETFLGLNDVKYMLNCSEDELVSMAKENGVTLETQRHVWNQNVKMVNFRFWQQIADCERDPLTVEAHRSIYQGKVAYAKGQISDEEDSEGNLKPSVAETHFINGIEKMAEVMKKYPQLSWHDDYVEEGMLAVCYWEKVHQYNGKAVPQSHPLKAMVLENAGRLPSIERQFILEGRLGL